MNSFWRFLRDKRNQQVLGWLGGGLVVATTGLWGVFVYFFPSAPRRNLTHGPSQRPGRLWWRRDRRQRIRRDHHDQPQSIRIARPNRNEMPAVKHYPSFVAALGMCFLVSIAAAFAEVKADTGSIAIGGSVTGSTLVIGIPQQKVDELVRDAKRPLEELTAQQRDNIVLLKEKLDLNERQVHAALAILGENDIPQERLAAKLVEIAERFKDLQATTSVRPGDNPKIAVLKTDAQKAIEAGQLADADALLADVEVRAEAQSRPLGWPMRQKHLRDAVTLHSPACGMAKPRSISPMRLHCFPHRALTRTADRLPTKRGKRPLPAGR